MPRRTVKNNPKLGEKIQKDQAGQTEKDIRLNDIKSPRKKGAYRKKHVLPVSVKKQPKKETAKRDKEVTDEQYEEYLEARRNAEIKKEPQGRIIYEREDKKKQLIMWGGVTFFMLVILIIWVYNIKTVFKQTAANQSSSSAMDEWKKTTEDIGEQMNKLQEDLQKIKEFSEQATTTAATGTEAGNQTLFASGTPAQIDQGKLDELKTKIEEMAPTTE